jgi:hypothetical protein
MKRQSILVVAVVIFLASNLSICRADMYDMYEEYNWVKPLSGGMGIITAYEFHIQPIGIGFGGNELYWYVTPSDIGKTFIASAATYPNFDYMASILTGDIIQGLRFETKEIIVGGGGGGSGMEVHDIGFLRGGTIERIELTINDIFIDSPGRDLNGDGNWTDDSFDVTYTFHGELVPVPSAVVLGSLGLAVASWRLRRMKHSNKEVT